MEMKPTSELEQAMANPPSAPVAFGEYTLGGKSALELGGSRVSRLVSRVVQDDEHYGLITVRETAELAVRLSNPPESPEQKTAAGVDPAETPAQEAARKAALLLEELGIDNVADTVLGNETVRGVSGGEAKRVTIMEALATPLRALVLDDASNGLDGARTKAIVAKLKEFARELRIPIVMALQQPSREVFDLFHRIVLMRHGRVLYEGPRDEAGAFLASIGLAPPSHQSVPDWLLEVASSPSLFSPSVAVLQDGARQDGLERFKFAPTLGGSRTGDPADSKASGKGGAARASPTEGKVDAGSDQSTGGVAVHLDEEGGLEDELGSASASGRGELPGFDPLAAVQALPALTTQGISEHFYAKWAPARPEAGRPAGGRIPGVRLAAAAPVQHPKELAWPKSQATDLLFGDGFAADSCTQMGLLLWRDTMLMLRDTEFLATHLVNSIIVALLLGGVFYQLGQEDFQQYVSLIFFASLFLGMGNFSSLPVTIQYRAVADKQVLAGMYHPTLYALSQALVSIPIAILETLIFISIVYWMCGFANDVGRFLIMAAMSLCINLFMAAYFRTVAWISGNAGFAAAQGMAIGPFALLMVTNGFVVTRENLSDALWWFSYVNPLAYGIRGLVVNEFSDSSYDNEIPIVEETLLPNGTEVTSILGTRRIGDAYLESYDMPTEDWTFWITLGFLVVLGEMLLCVAGGTAAYSCIRTYGSRGTAREENTKEEEDAARKISKRVIDGVASGRLTPEIEMARARSSPSEEAAHGKSSGASAGSSHGSSMVWDNVKYTVKLPDGSDKTLLHGISGWAKPGQITALLGESGAGKSTLLDCLAGRKNQGKLEGSILLDGKPATRDAINLVASYVEQFDHHVPQQTVKEALEFSADLRLPAGTPASERAKVVDRVLDLLELTSIQNSRIGLPGASGISAGERKRLSIAVELVSQPRIIFLDEPTTGLSSLQALGLMRALRRIADAGHSIVATVHQPSASIFFQMDRLLLLRRGGATVYFGPLGEKGSALIKYMESCRGVRPLPLGTNPADWMLEVVGEAGRASQSNSKAGDDGDIESKGETVPDLAVQFNGSEAANVMKAGLAALRSGEGLSAAPAAPEHPSWLQEFGVVLSRTATVSWRDVDYNTSRTIAVPFLAAMFGLTFLQLDDVDQAGVFSVIGASFMGATFLAIVLLNLSIPPLMTVRPSLYRELDAGFFTPESWALATTLMEVPWVACLSAAFSAILYFMVGLDPANYGEFYATLLTLSLAMTMMGHAVAMGSGSQQTATAIAGSTSSIMFLFGGFLVTGPDMAPGWKWLHYIVPIRYGLAGLVTPAFHCPEDGLEGPDMPAGERGPCSTVTIVRDGQLQAGVVKSDYIDDFMGFRFEDIGFYTGMLVGYFVLFAALKMLLLRFVRHQSR